MYRRSGNPMEAIRSFDKAIELDPQHEISRMNKGIVLLHDLGDEKGAIRAWEELLKINPLAVSPTGQSVAQMLSRMKSETLNPGGNE
jgi:tetratricopeptide (TPR) repeat protein